MLKSLDRYILRNELAAFAAVVFIVSALLMLENVQRVWNAISGTSAPIMLLLQMLLALLPEYLAVGVLMASFVAPAWVIRSLALRSEWQVLPGIGLGPWRVMLAPLLVAGAATSAELAIRLVVEPFGERSFEQLGDGLERGAFGLPIQLRDFVELDPRTTIYLAPADQGSRSLGPVFLRRGDDVFSARSASAARDKAGRIAVELFDGREIVHDRDGKDRVLEFKSYGFTFSPNDASPERFRTAERLDRLPPDELLRGVAQEIGVTGPHPATASLMARVSSALFCLLLPWMALVLAQPPRRERSGGAILLGVGAIVLFLRTNSLVEAHFHSWPISAAVGHLGLWIGATIALVRFGARHDAGVIDHVLNRLYSTVARAGERPDPWRWLEHKSQATRRLASRRPA
jgi:lipopolysaccharide export system permease protein